MRPLVASALVLLVSCQASPGQPAPDHEQAFPLQAQRVGSVTESPLWGQVPATQEALATLRRLTGLSSEDDVSQILKALSESPLRTLSGERRARHVLDELEMQKWGNHISEFVELMGLVFGFEEPAFIRERQSEFDAAIEVLQRFRQTIQSEVGAHHPGLDPYEASELLDAYQGRGIRVAVVDTFDTVQLDAQRLRYPDARIEPLVRIGDPVELTHGNCVIDVILSIAPGVTLLPVSSDAEHDGEVLARLAARSGVQVLNLSRAFAERNGGLDPEYARLLTELGTRAVVSKSLGNTGTDLEGRPNRRRREEGLGPVGNLFAYDMSLIDEHLAELARNGEPSTLLFAINGTLFGDDIARSATTPGMHRGVQARALTTLADGVYCWSTDNFEAGSSFGAPQIAAFAALLLESLAEEPGIHNQEVADALLRTARQGVREKSDFGAGLLSGAALAALKERARAL